MSEESASSTENREEAEEQAIYRESLGILAEIAGRSYAAGESIFAEGELGTDIYFILTGAVRVYLRQHDGSQRELMSLAEGDIFGEMALINHLPRSASVEAVIATRAVVLDRKLFYHLVGEYPILAKKVIELMGRRMSAMDSQFKAVIARTSD